MLLKYLNFIGRAVIHNNTPDRLFTLRDLGLLKVSGPGALKLLQGQLSCDMEAMLPGTGAMGAHCNPQGRVISLFYAARIHDDFYLAMPLPLIPIAMSALKKYAPFFKAEVQDASGSYQIIGATEIPHAILPDAVIKLPSHTNRKILLVQTVATLEQEAAEHWKLLDMREGIPAIYPQTSGKFLPHDLNLPALNAVSFSKGCFTGQEIIARMQYRGKPKNHLYRGLSSAALQPGEQLFLNEKPAGTVIDCCQNVYNDQYALLLTTDETTAQQHQLQTEQSHLIELQKSEES